jgi:hypothetical protein
MIPRKKRLEFLILSLTGFLTGTVLYGIMALVVHFYGDPQSKPSPVFLAFVPLLGGYMFFSIVSGVQFVARWLSKRHLAVKILLTIFFPIPFYMVGLGMFYSLPYGIYNLVMYLKKDPPMPPMGYGPPPQNVPLPPPQA